MSMNTDEMIFVFGSNLSGYHGAGAARFARLERGAIMGRGIGRQGQSWAIPTKDAEIMHTLGMGQIKAYVNLFIEEARLDLNEQYQITQIGCGLAGLRPIDVAPMFRFAPQNCFFDTAWRDYLGSNYGYWGTL